MYYIKGDGYNGLMELQTKLAGGIFRGGGFCFVAVKKRGAKTERGVFPLAIKKKANKAPNERAEIAPSPHSAPAKGRGGAGQAVSPCFGLLFDYWGFSAIKNRGIFIPHTSRDEMR